MKADFAENISPLRLQIYDVADYYSSYSLVVAPFNLNTGSHTHILQMQLVRNVHPFGKDLIA